MVRNNVFQHIEPKGRELSQYLSLLFDRCRQDNIERRKAVRRDKQQTIVIDLLNVSYFAAVKKFEV
jgi:hypothetical protein